jgi:hypothetical protein
LGLFKMKSSVRFARDEQISDGALWAIAKVWCSKSDFGIQRGLDEAAIQEVYCGEKA